MGYPRRKTAGSLPGVISPWVGQYERTTQVAILAIMCTVSGVSSRSSISSGVVRLELKTKTKTKITILFCFVLEKNQKL